ncbi:hypothetical protein QJS83_14175 [Bdellovibrio sp. 22V]|uniref:hypothetical protein n=1 Tax=Bdellovibrio TaxID=958 RepID=UPI002543256A|nr:hypothetical protein [Bdellovibrio sp. 22V]WII71612.1 hypothetical protein QJS83_14175 [Bdellovibrio sp. 22V]
MLSKNRIAFLFIIKSFLIVLAGILSPLFSYAQQFDSCVQFALEESFPKIAVGEKSKFFVKCVSEKSTPEAHQPRPRYSSMEIKALSRAYQAITDCLEIEPQWLFPKFMMESGFHVQIQNLQWRRWHRPAHRKSYCGCR